MSYILIFNPDDSRILQALRELQSRDRAMVQDLEDKLRETTKSSLSSNQFAILELDLASYSRTSVDNLLSNAIAYPLLAEYPLIDSSKAIIDFSRGMLHSKSHLKLTGIVGGADKTLPEGQPKNQYSLDFTD